MLPSIPWWAWAALAAALSLGEMHVPGSYLIWIALGAAVTAAADAAFQLSLETQIAVFLGAAVVSCLVGWRVYGRLGTRRRGGPPLNERDQLMVGRHGVVCTALVDGRGKVRLGDSVWLAEGEDLPEGAPVVVRSVRGTSVVVDAAGDRRASSSG